MKLLLERDADVYALNAEGETPYRVSLAYGYRETASFLLGHGACKASFEDNVLQYGSDMLSDWHLDFSP